MKQIRLLPLVIAVAGALLLLKSIGIMTNGGYVLIGPSTAEAAGGGGGEAADANNPTLATPVEPTIEDNSPELSDIAPTLPLGPEPAPAEDQAVAEGSEAAADGEHGEASAEGDAAAETEGEEAVAEAEEAAAGDDTVDVAAAVEGCPPAGASAEATAEPAEATSEAASAEADGLDFIHAAADCPAEVNDHGDALPTMADGAGNIVPLAPGDGSAPSEDVLLERLAERRDDLDARESELDMRMALVEAAEKRIDERTAVLEALEARINAMVDEKRTLEEAQFVALVAMYETMKAKDAAAIFDQLEMPVLLRVARAINPRKMAPIMAKMDPLVAKELTAGLAVDQVEPTIELGEEDLAALPQIVGQ